MWLFKFNHNHNNNNKNNYCLKLSYHTFLLILLSLLLFTTPPCHGLEWITDDSVIVEPEIVQHDDYEAELSTLTHDDDGDDVSRENRQIVYHFPSASSHFPIQWPMGTSGHSYDFNAGNAAAVTNGFGSCTTRRGEIGVCATLRQCFPALYTTMAIDDNNDEQMAKTSSANVLMTKQVISNPPLADLLRSISGSCRTSTISNQFYFKADAQLLRQNLICCSNQEMYQPNVVHAQAPEATTMKATVFKYPNRPKIPIGFGGHRPPGATHITPIKRPNEIKQEPTTTERHYVVESSCGIPKIVGGNETYHGKYPWVVALLNGQKQICGGSLIDNQFVLTAAHCVAHMRPADVARVRILIGAHNTHQINQGSVVKKIIKLMRHRGFSHKTLHNDIAILKLDSPVKFTTKIRPVCLDQPQQQIRYENTRGIVAGWGSVSEFGAQPQTLHEVTIDIWSNAQCKAKYGNLAPGGIMDHMMCAGSNARDACRGDSGGPLMIFDKNLQIYSQIGLVSWGIGCGRFPGVYTRIADFRQWIDKQREL